MSSAYLSNRYQSVSVAGVLSDKVNVQFGVPQGSVLGPQLFSLYMSPLVSIIHNCGLQCHTYADDTQIYVAINPKCQNEFVNNVSNIQNCVKIVKSWMTSNFLKLNDSKTEVLFLSTKQVIGKHLISSIIIDETEVKIEK